MKKLLIILLFIAACKKSSNSNNGITNKNTITTTDSITLQTFGTKIGLVFEHPYGVCTIYGHAYFYKVIFHTDTTISEIDSLYSGTADTTTYHVKYITLSNASIGLLENGDALEIIMPSPYQYYYTEQVTTTEIDTVQLPFTMACGNWGGDTIAVGTFVSGLVLQSSANATLGFLNLEQNSTTLGLPNAGYGKLFY